MPVGLNENFPVNVHRVEGFSTPLSIKQLQQKILKCLFELNKREFSFEEVTDPTVPNGIVVFEFGLAQAEGYVYLDEDELSTALGFVSTQQLQILDFFCAVRYYKICESKKSPLKFDYYQLRVSFGKEILEMQVFHERGPRYVSPKDLVVFIVQRLNKQQSKVILRPIIT